MAGLFLPFTPKGKAIEIKAIAIKRDFGYGPYDLIDPRELAQRMNVVVIPEEWLLRLEESDRSALLVDHASTWSAGSIIVKDRLHVVLNPTHSVERQSPTLAEELVHQALGHPASQLLVLDGTTMRTCQHEVESEAYAVATALLMPYRSTFNHLKDRGTIETIPAAVAVSAACRAYRTKMAGLWRMAPKPA
jgi:Zn-dependent peptidase ImmA (M78 family)